MIKDLLPYINNVYTSYDSLVLMYKLDDLLKNLYKVGNISIYDQLVSSLGITITSQILTDLELSVLEPVHSPLIKDLLLELKSKLQNLPVVHLELAFKPDFNLTKEMHGLLTTKIEKPFILHILTTEAIVAGFKLSYAGQLYDKSYERCVSKYFLDFKI